MNGVERGEVGWLITDMKSEPWDVKVQGQKFSNPSIQTRRQYFFPVFTNTIMNLHFYTIIF